MNKEKKIFIVRCGEVALKGLNKPYFERMLVDRIRRVLRKYNEVEVKRNEGLIFVKTPGDLDPDLIVGEISRVFGVASISPAIEVDSDLDEIGKAAVEFMQELIEKKRSKNL
jgi:thiamine biosynthesis protein ThiI